jgi:hypothetical protein
MSEADGLRCFMIKCTASSFVRLITAYFDWLSDYDKLGAEERSRLHSLAATIAECVLDLYASAFSEKPKNVKVLLDAIGKFRGWMSGDVTDHDASVLREGLWEIHRESADEVLIFLVTDHALTTDIPHIWRMAELASDVIGEVAFVEIAKILCDFFSENNGGIL